MELIDQREQDRTEQDVSEPETTTRTTRCRRRRKAVGIKKEVVEELLNEREHKQSTVAVQKYGDVQGALSPKPCPTALSARLERTYDSLHRDVAPSRPALLPICQEEIDFYLTACATYQSAIQPVE